MVLSLRNVTSPMVESTFVADDMVGCSAASRLAHLRAELVLLRGEGRGQVAHVKRPGRALSGGSRDSTCACPEGLKGQLLW